MSFPFVGDGVLGSSQVHASGRQKQSTRAERIRILSSHYVLMTLTGTFSMGRPGAALRNGQLTCPASPVTDARESLCRRKVL